KIIGVITGGNGDRIANTERLQCHIADRFNMEPAQIQISTPGRGERPGPDPIAWLILGLSREQARYLLDCRALVSDTLTVTFHSYTPRDTGFADTYEGLTIPIEEGAAVRDTFRAAVANDANISRFVRAHRKEYPAYMTSDEAFNLFVTTIRVQAIWLLGQLPRGAFIAWNVYFVPPTQDLDHLATLRSFFRRLVVNGPHGVGGQASLYQTPLRCKVCNGTDHPSNLCPLEDVPGYLEVTHETVDELLDISR
ncbi:hypothetical protein R3P38DRAFT_2470021, partial [Favolaschia claudopus]